VPDESLHSVRSLSAQSRQHVDDLAAAGLGRSLRAVSPLGGCRVSRDGVELTSFASCDYLGLAAHPRLAAAAAEASVARGTSAGSARLLVGHCDEVAALESELADYFGQPAALVFGSGYLANVGLLTALAGEHDLIVSDALSHASTVDACRLTRATVKVVPHNDVAAVAQSLAGGAAYRRRFVLVEGVYSMDGDIAPLGALADVCRDSDALLVVDDAHGLGSVGPGGRGVVAGCGQGGAVAAQIGNLGKALGSYGGFVLVDEGVRELLTQTSRSFVFTCALPPGVVAAAREALVVLREEPQRVEKLARNVRQLLTSLCEVGLSEQLGWRRPLSENDNGFSLEQADSLECGARLSTMAPIIPVLVGDSRRACALSDRLADRGWLVPAVRPPTVPEGSSRLRITVNSEHDEDECRRLAADLADELRAL
jgi:8-amino-7-oxononanoate synthase